MVKPYLTDCKADSWRRAPTRTGDADGWGQAHRHGGWARNEVPRPVATLSTSCGGFYAETDAFADENLKYGH